MTSGGANNIVASDDSPKFFTWTRFASARVTIDWNSRARSGEYVHNWDR